MNVLTNDFFGQIVIIYYFLCVYVYQPINVSYRVVKSLLMFILSMMLVGRKFPTRGNSLRVMVSSGRCGRSILPGVSGDATTE